MASVTVAIARMTTTLTGVVASIPNRSTSRKAVYDAAAQFSAR
jgi:hypothetical protein